MANIGEWIRRLRYLLRRGALEEELRLEMEDHRARMGDTRAFGNTLRLRDEARDAWGWRWLDELARDSRLALRSLRHSPGFAITAMLTLALGIGANISMFTVVNSVLLRPLFERADRVMAVYGRVTGPSAGSGPSEGAGEYRGVSYPDYLDLHAATTDIFTHLGAFTTRLIGVDAGQGARRALALGVTADYFQIFERPLALGRSFTKEEERLADTRVAILSYGLWQQRGADPGIIGQTVGIDGEPFTIVGVTSKGFTGTAIPGPEVWLPLGAPASETRDARELHQLGVIGRLRAGVSDETASAALATVGDRLAGAYPASNAGSTLVLTQPSRLMFMPGPGSDSTMAAMAVLLMIMPLIVLLVACLNLANLLIARGHVRRRELAIRSSLGGGRFRLVRQLLTEGLLLALAGAAIGLVLSTWVTDALLATLRPVLPFALTLPELDVDWRVLAGTIAFTLVATLVFCAWPAWDSTGAITTDLNRRAGDESRQPGGIRIGNVLVIAQVALSLLLLAAAGLFLKSSIGAATVDPGFRLERGLLAEVDPGLAGYDNAEARRFQLALVDRLRTIAGVESVTIASSFPFTEFGDSRIVARAGDSASSSTRIDAGFMAIGRDYARTLGLRMLDGRDFTDADLTPLSAQSVPFVPSANSTSSQRVAIVDDALARQLWPKENAVGQLIQLMDDEGVATGSPLQVVGIVSAVHESFGNPTPSPHVYVPIGHDDDSAMTLQLRVAEGQDEGAMLTTVARVIRELDVRVPALRLQTWRARLDASVELWIFRAGTRVCAAFGGIALLLAVIGVYGVKSYVVSRRTREFGVRLAVGAHPRDLLWQVMRENGRITIAGIVIGLLLALGAGQLLQHVLYRVNSVEPIVLIAAPLILLAASLLASFLPALRATRVDPTVALRVE